MTSTPTLREALEQALRRAKTALASPSPSFDGWHDIATAPKEPLRKSPQSEWLKGREHGPAILIAHTGEGFEEWKAHVG